MRQSVILISVLIISFSIVLGQTMSIQGVIRDDTGASVHGSYNIEFRLYTAASGGSAAWSETQTLTVTNGVYSALLGSVNSLVGLNYDVSYWLGISIDGTDELSPRTKLTMSPYAIMAGMNGTTNIFPQDGDVVIGSDAQIGGDLMLGWNSFLGVSGSDADWQNNILGWTWTSGIGDHLDFYVPGNSNPDTKLMSLDEDGNLELTNSLITRQSGTLISNSRSFTDNFRIRYDNDLFGTNLDGLIIEKTDGNSTYPDGGIMFANTGNDNIVDVSMVIRGDGKIGMATPDPTHLFDVRGQVRIDYPGSNYDVWIQGGSVTSGEARNLAILGHSAYDKLYLNYGGEYSNGTVISGNVGIATSSPARRLHIVGPSVASNANSYSIRIQLPSGSAAGTDYWDIGIDDESGDEDLIFSMNGTSRGWIDPDGSYQNSSDRRLKKNIEPVTGMLPRLLALKPRTFNMNTESDSDPRSIGLIAQDVKEIFPELDVVQENEGMLGLSYSDFSVMAIAAIQEQQEIINDLLERIEDLENKVNE